MNITSMKFAQLINALSVETIQPMSLHSDRLGEQPPDGSEIKLEYRQGFAEGDPVRDQSGKLVFRMKTELTINGNEKIIFRQETVFLLVVVVKNEAMFNDSWSDTDTQKLFLDGQLKKTIWPFFREQVHSAMLRLGLPPVVLPLMM